MAGFSVDTNGLVAASRTIVEIGGRLGSYSAAIESENISGALSGRYSAYIDNALKSLSQNLAAEAAQSNSMGEALNLIANRYVETEEDILANISTGFGGSLAANGAAAPGAAVACAASSGTDKRGGWARFWSWLTGDEPDEYEATTQEQQDAADEAMRKAIWEVLQDEKYSRKNWEKASIEERKQILQDYMNELIKIYGLQDIYPTIVWGNLQYDTFSFTMGGYAYEHNALVLNENVLSDKNLFCNSYDLLGTLGHELRHAYQVEAVNNPTRFMVTKETIDQWANNMKDGNYIEHGTDYEKYLTQPIEKDAERFNISRDDQI